MPEETPHLARGPIQLQGQMLITGHKWGAVCVLYQGIELRVFLFAPHDGTQTAIAQAVTEFQQKLDTYRETGAIDWYPPASSKELDRIFPSAIKDEVELPPTVADLAKGIMANKAAIRAAEDRDDFRPFEALMAVLARPFEDQPEHAAFASPPKPEERVLATFCGT
jgi:hypothetical protein